jgi:hypothetical protein
MLRISTGWIRRGVLGVGAMTLLVAGYGFGSVVTTASGDNGTGPYALRIISGPSPTTDGTTAFFEWTATDPNTSADPNQTFGYTCAVDSGSPTGCGTGTDATTTISSLAYATHTFTVVGGPTVQNPDTTYTYDTDSWTWAVTSTPTSTQNDTGGGGGASSQPSTSSSNGSSTSGSTSSNSDWKPWVGGLITAALILAGGLGIRYARSRAAGSPSGSASATVLPIASQLVANSLEAITVDDEWSRLARLAQTRPLTPDERSQTAQYVHRLQGLITGAGHQVHDLQQAGVYPVAGTPPNLDEAAFRQAIVAVRDSYLSEPGRPYPALLDEPRLTDVIAQAGTLVFETAAAEARTLDTQLRAVVEGEPPVGDLPHHFRCALYIVAAAAAMIACAITAGGGARIAELTSQGALAVLGYEKSGCAEAILAFQNRTGQAPNEGD